MSQKHVVAMNLFCNSDASRLKIAAYKLLHGFDTAKGTRKDSIGQLMGSEHVQIDQSPAFGYKFGYKLNLFLKYLI